jgi:hypothetical protein
MRSTDLSKIMYRSKVSGGRSQCVGKEEEHDPPDGTARGAIHGS